MKIKNLSINLLLSLVSIIIFLFSAELLATKFYQGQTTYDRSVWPEFGEERLDRDNYFSSEDGLSYNIYTQEINSSAYALFDDNEIKEKMNGKETRVAVIGDSYTWGASLANPAAERFTTVLQELLDEQATSSSGALVLPFGRAALNTYQEYILFKELILDYEPDIFVLQYCNNDSDPIRLELSNQQQFVFATTDVLFVDNEVVPIFPFLSRSKNYYLLDNFKFARYISRKLNTTLINVHQDTDSDFEWLNKIIELAQASDIEFVLLEFPPAFGSSVCAAGSPNREYYQRLHDAIADKEITSINMCDATTDFSLLSTGFGKDLHYNKYGHRLAAEKLKDVIIEKISN